MKKGKSVKLNLYNPIKSVYGTVDSKNLKSVYINIQSWVTPKFEYDNWNRIVCNLSRDIKHSVFNSINHELFKEKSIVDLDLRTSGIAHGKKSFLNRITSYNVCYTKLLRYVFFEYIFNDFFNRIFHLVGFKIYFMVGI